MVKAECIKKVKDSRIKVEDHKSKRVLIIRNPSRLAHEKIRFDSCVVQQQTAADWIVIKEGVGSLIVELKGSHVTHAVNQVFSSATYLKTNQMSTGYLGAIVMCTKYPRVDSSILRAKDRFAREFRGRLHFSSHDVEVDFDEAVSKHAAKLYPHS